MIVYEDTALIDVYEYTALIYVSYMNVYVAAGSLVLDVPAHVGVHPGARAVDHGDGHVGGQLDGQARPHRVLGPAERLRQRLERRLAAVSNKARG